MIKENIGYLNDIMPVETINQIQRTVTKDIISYLDKANVKHSYLGFDYLSEAIEIGLYDKSKVCKGLTRTIYPAIALNNKVAVTNVERCIRKAVQSSAYPDVTNAEFIARAVDEIKVAKL